MSSVICLVSAVTCSMSSVICLVSTIQFHLSSVRCQVFYVQCPLSSVLCPVSAVRCSMTSVLCHMSSVLLSSVLRLELFPKIHACPDLLRSCSLSVSSALRFPVQDMPSNVRGCRSRRVWSSHSHVHILKKIPQGTRISKSNYSSILITRTVTGTEN